MVEAQCERVRMLYRDCARPPPPPLQTERRQVGVITFVLHFLLKPSLYLSACVEMDRQNALSNDTRALHQNMCL